MAENSVFHIDKDDDAQMRAFHLSKDLYERIIEAENLALMNEIKANTVVINGRKYGMLKDKPGLVPTIFGMKAETKTDMPDEWDFFLQERPPQPLTNYDRIISKTPEELAVWLARQEYRRPRFDGWLPLCNHVMGAKVCHAHGCEACWLDWLQQEAEP